MTGEPRRSSGSSPLARGLLSGPAGVIGPVGIIPARAGFTRWVAVFATLHGDHPRSRGVYRERTSRWWN